MSLSRRQFTVGTVTAIAATAPGLIYGENTKQRNRFVIGMNCYTPIRFNLEECLDQIKETPFRKIELPVWALYNSKVLIPEFMVDVSLGGQWQYSIPDLEQLLSKGNFQVECVCVVGHLAAYPGSEGILKRRIDFAARLGVKLINLALCPFNPTEENRKTVYSMLRNIGRYATEKNICLAVETWGGITRNADEALRTLHEVDMLNVGINFDTGNVLLKNPDMDAASLPGELQRLAKHIRYVHLKDVVRKKATGQTTTVLGQGEIDFRQVFDILHNAGFYGPFDFDLETTRATQSGDIRESQKDLLASVEYLRSLGEFDA